MCFPLFDFVLLLRPAMACALQYGKVYKGLWRGTVVAVKSMMLPFGMTGVDKHERCVHLDVPKLSKSRQLRT